MDNPLTIVPSEGSSNDFPVLKAFQEYIDAEQAKARKRMLGLSVFFIVLLFVVVVTFVLILITVLNRNQSLSDRLLDYALREREKVTVQQTPIPVVQQQPSADIVNTIVARLEKEQAEMKAALEKQKKEAEEKAIEAKRIQAQEIARIKAELEKEKAKAQKEAERKAEIERHRRRLYPDYYRSPDDQLEIPPPASTFRKKNTPPPSSSLPEAQSQEPVQQKKKTSQLSNLKPVTYFNVDDDDSVPFLLESPK